jgi:hypothetical protein
VRQAEVGVDASEKPFRKRQTELVEKISTAETENEVTQNATLIRTTNFRIFGTAPL